MTTRRKLLVVFAAAALHLSLPPTAQPAAKIPRIGVLERGPSENLEAFKQGVRALGYVEPKNIVYEYRYTEGKLAEFPRLAA